MNLPDIQKTIDTRGVPIDRVGVTGIRLPIRLLRKPTMDETLKEDWQDSVGVFELSCNLPRDVKGTHMSRFTEVLMEHIDKESGVFSHTSLAKVADVLMERMQASCVEVSVKAVYFMPQVSPVTGRKGIAPIDVGLSVSRYNFEGTIGLVEEWMTSVQIEGMTCCPCSKEISDYHHSTQTGKGAHSQRSMVSLQIHHAALNTIWFEDLAGAIQAAYSSPVYPVLKRPDERAVTIAAYENPKFVEDVIRDVVVNLGALHLKQLGGTESWQCNVRVCNAESIHYHDAFASLAVRFPALL